MAYHQKHLSSARSEGVGSRVVEPVGSASASVRVAIPPEARQHAGLHAGDELRVAVTESSEVAFFPYGVPFTDDVRLYAGNASVVENKRQLKVVILRKAKSELDIEAGDTVEFAVEQGVVYLSPVGFDS